MTSITNYKYAGFWIRVAAALIDTLLIMVIIAPALSAFYGIEYWTESRGQFEPADILLNYVFPALAIIVFWIYKSATPGKLMFGIEIIDAESGGKLTTAQCVGRYLSYYVATLPLLLGLIWVAFDKRKQGWHDKLAGTLVIYKYSPPAATDSQP